MHKLIVSLLAIICTSCNQHFNFLAAQDSAPSSHLVFDDGFDGDIIINQVRVPDDGEALYTYYETLGWRGKGAGYAGIQSHPKARNFIFSIWDHKDHRGPIRAVYKGPGTETQKFGGEGTGLKSWNFKLGWSTDKWYTLVARCWPVKDHTYYGFWVRSGELGPWSHLVTMDVATKNARFRGGTDAFIEDWLSTGEKRREVHFRRGWKRKMGGEWFAFQNARYSVNAWDLTEGKRSYHYRSNWNGGVVKTTEAEYFFMQSGGKETQPTTKNPSTHGLPRKLKLPDLKVISIKSFSAEVDANKKVWLRWAIDDSKPPQFGYRIEIKKKGNESDSIQYALAEAFPSRRKATIQLAADDNIDEYEARLTCTDIFDGTAAPKTTTLVLAKSRDEKK